MKTKGSHSTRRNESIQHYTALYKSDEGQGEAIRITPEPDLWKVVDQVPNRRPHAFVAVGVHIHSM